MAYKIPATSSANTEVEVVGDNRNLSLTSDSGAVTVLYDQFYASTANNLGGSNVINFSYPFLLKIMTGNATFTEIGFSTGKITTLLLDTSSSLHTPSFSSNMNWADATEPTWSGYRYWQITFMCNLSNNVNASAVGFTAAGGGAPTEAITLEGTSGTPESFFDMAGSDANDLVMGWRFDSDGNVYKYESIYNVGGNGLYLHDTTTWDNITPSTTYYIRATNFSGVNMSTVDSDTLNTWLALTSDRDFRYRDSTQLITYADRDGTMKIEISTTSNGSNIVATGYYKCEWSGLA
jgi:hypothetical protein